MINPNNKHITVVRGDDIQVPLFINKGTTTAPERYLLDVNDRVEFTVLQTAEWPTYEIKVVVEGPQIPINDEDDNPIDPGDIIFNINHDQTGALYKGTHFYNIKLITTTDGAEYITTLVPNTDFDVVE